MANEKFKVKFGLAVGDTAATIDATTGEGVFAEGDNGQITVGKGVGDNGRIEIGLTGRTVAGTPYIDFHSSASSVDYDARILTSGPTTPTGSGEGTLTITAASLVHSGNLTVNGNLQVDGNTVLGNGSGDTVTITGNTIKSSTTNTALQLDDVNVKVGGELTITGNRIRSSGGSAFPLGDIAVQLNGNNVEVVGILQVTGNTIRASDGNTAQTYNVLTGQYPNITTTGNIVKGAIRNPLVEAAGNIFSFSTTSAGGPTRGISIDNSATGATAQRPGIVLRAYGAGLGSGNPLATVITETARGSAATPTGLTSGNSIATYLAGGYADTSAGGTGAGWVSDTTGNTVASFGFQTTENWTGGTGAGSPLGTRFRVSTNPTGSANSIQTSLEINPQSTLARSDAFTWSQGKTGTAQTMALDVSGNLTTTGNLTVSGTGTSTIGGDLRINGGDIQNPGGTNAITLTTSNATTTIVGDTVNITNNSGTGGSRILMSGSGAVGGSYVDIGDVNIAQMSSSWQSVFSPGFKYTGLMSDTTTTGAGSYFEMSSRWKATAGSSTFSTPLSGWGLGRFGFSADNSTTGTSQINSGAIQAKATENWSSTATGSSLTFIANKAGVAGSAVDVLNMSPENTYMNADTIIFSNQAATVNYLNLDSDSATFANPVQFPNKTAAQWNAITGAVGMQVCVNNSPVNAGKMAYWDTTNARWSYVDSNLAI